jgi:hypothetical protein
LKPARAAQEARVDSGVDRHEWESELSALEEHLTENPAEALPELDDLVARMLEATGIDDHEVVAEYEAAHEVTEALERDSDEISPGDVAAAINGYRAVFAAVVSSRTGELPDEP